MLKDGGGEAVAVLVSWYQLDLPDLLPFVVTKPIKSHPIVSDQTC